MGGRWGAALLVAMGIAWTSFGAVPASAAALTPVGGVVDGSTTAAGTQPPHKAVQPTPTPTGIKHPATNNTQVSQPTLVAGTHLAITPNTITLPNQQSNQQFPAFHLVGNNSDLVAVTLADGSVQVLPASTFAKQDELAACIRDTVVALRQQSPASSLDALQQAATTICQRQASH